MKKFLKIIFLILVNSSFAYSQSALDQIKKDYYTYKSEENNHEIFVLEREFDDISQVFKFYHNRTQLLYVVLTHSSEFHGYSKEYFYKDGEVFFIYRSESGENYFEEPVRKYWQTDYRYYLDNEKPLQILFKKGYLEGSSNLDSLMSVTPNVKVNPEQSGNLGWELQNSKALMNTFNSFMNYR